MRGMICSSVRAGGAIAGACSASAIDSAQLQSQKNAHAEKDFVQSSEWKMYWALQRKRIFKKRTKRKPNGQNRARNGKDKVKLKPKSVKVKSQPSEENTT
ncbi:hypothetical protein Tco_1374357 [Tanacetum coccineum]